MPQKSEWDVFVSHNRIQKPWVRDAVAQWRSCGLRVFFDEDCIEPGEHILEGIERGLTGSRHIVLVITPLAIKSKWIAMETANAILDDSDAPKRLIPMILEPTNRSDVRLSVRGLNMVDLTDPGRRDGNYRGLLTFLGVSETRHLCPPAWDAATISQIGAIGSTAIETASGGALIDTCLIELNINRDFESYSSEDQEKLLLGIRALLGIGTLKIVSKRRGSVLLTLELTHAQAETLLHAVKRGHFDVDNVCKAFIRETVYFDAALARRGEDWVQGGGNEEPGTEEKHSEAIASENLKPFSESHRAKGIHTRGEQLTEARGVLDDLIETVADIAVMAGYIVEWPNANLTVGKNAVVNGISVQDAKTIGNLANFEYFTTRLGEFRQSWIKRLSLTREEGHSIPTPDDLEWTFYAERLGLDSRLAMPLRGLALHEFLKQRTEFTNTFLFMLNNSVARGFYADSNDVHKAFDKALESTWRKRHPINRHVVNICQSISIVVMAASPFAMQWNKVVGTILLTVGVGCNAFSIYLTKN